MDIKELKQDLAPRKENIELSGHLLALTAFLTYIKPVGDGIGLPLVFLTLPTVSSYTAQSTSASFSPLLLGADALFWYVISALGFGAYRRRSK